MDVYAYAMKVETDGEKYYRDLAAKTNDIGLKSILTMLADEEVKHYAIFEKMSQKQPLPIQTPVDIFNSAKTIFQKMRENNQKACFSHDEVEFYKGAFKLEEKSYQFYTDKAQMIDDPEERAIFLRIAEEEKKHMTLLGNLIEYVSFPDRWIESAEFEHIDGNKTAFGYYPS